MVLGAFGAHALSGVLDGRTAAVWDTAVRYHAVHAVASVALSAAGPLWRSPWCAAAGTAWLAGIALFSGSLYALALTGIGWLGAITPIGGLALIAGWICLALSASVLREGSPG